MGIISFGIGCGRPDYVGMNSRVSYAAGWIEGLKCDISDYPPSSCGQPTPPPPTPSPTEDPGIPGSIEVYFRTDDYPEEVSWTIIDTQTEPPWPLVFVPYNDMEYRNVKYQRVFGNMSPGRYVMRVSDKAGGT